MMNKSVNQKTCDVNDSGLSCGIPPLVSLALMFAANKKKIKKVHLIILKIQKVREVR